MVARPTIVLIGPPGSGKGTQAQLLAKSLDGVHLSSGQVLREHATDAIKREMEQGQLVIDSEVESILENSLTSAPTDRLLILDGYLRLEQDRIWLEGCLHKLGRVINAIIVIDASKELSKQRVLGRGRSDDTVAAWTERWAEYEQITVPVIRSLASLPVIRVDGARDPQALNLEIGAALAQLGITK